MAALRNTTVSCPISRPTARSWPADFRSRASPGPRRSCVTSTRPSRARRTMSGRPARSGNAIACPPALATLAELRKPGMYQRLFKTGARLREGLAAAARKHGLAAQVSGEPPVFDIFFTDRPVVDYRATLTADRDRIKRFNQELVARGMVKAVNKIYVSLAHSDQDVNETLEIFDQALSAIAASA